MLDEKTVVSKEPSVLAPIPSTKLKKKNASKQLAPQYQIAGYGHPYAPSR
jgi:hypothetical protein